MASYYWIKLYDDILDDPKMGRLSDSAFRLAINLFLLAGRSEERDGRLPDISDIAWTLRINSDALMTQWAELEQAGIVSVVDDSPMVTNFSKRQSPLSPAEKQKLYRDRKRGEALQPSNQSVTEGVTKSNADIYIDKDKNIYIPPDPEPISRIKTALAVTTKTAFKPSTEDDYDRVAYMIFGFDGNPEQVEGFGEWWKQNGFYTGLPALKTLEDEYRNYLSGIAKAPQSQNNGIGALTGV